MQASLFPMDGDQAVIPGAEKESDKTRAARAARAPIKAKADQEGPESLGGLFGDEGKQQGLFQTQAPKAETKPAPMTFCIFGSTHLISTNRSILVEAMGFTKGKS